MTLPAAAKGAAGNKGASTNAAARTAWRPQPSPCPPSLQVYRMSSSPIGCSLAEAAESAAYDRFLSEVGGHWRPGRWYANNL